MLEGKFRSYFGAVCVPILDKGDGTISNVTHDWANAVGSLGGGLAVTVIRLQLRNKRVDLAKQKLAEMALANNVQWLLFVDDDVLPPPDGLAKMITLWKSDPKYKVISGMYWSKSRPSFPLIFKEGLEGSFWDWTTSDLIQCDSGGAGFLFIDAQYLKSLSKPWFSCNYYFDDPRGILDVQAWDLSDKLSSELMKGIDANKDIVEHYQKQMKDLAEEIKKAPMTIPPGSLMKDAQRSESTTEDIYFFKKMKDETGDRPWFDCSIQCMHQDKRTGEIFGIGPDFPQAQARYSKKLQKDKKVVVDIGAGLANYWLEEGEAIRIDNDPACNPDIIADARVLPLEDCFADVVFSSHTLEHFSFHETVSVLKEWIRIAKIGGKIVIVVPNLKWAANKILNGASNPEDAERALYMHYSAQKGDLRSAQTDVHRAGFTKDSMIGLLKSIPGLKDIEVHTSDGNYSNWKEPFTFHADDLGYNVIAFATKEYHDAPVSIRMNLVDQQKMKYDVGEKAKDVSQMFLPKSESKVETDEKGHDLQCSSSIGKECDCFKNDKIREKSEKKLKEKRVKKS